MSVLLLLTPPHSVTALLSTSQTLVRLLSVILAAPSHKVVLTDACPAAILPPVCFAVMITDARPDSLLTACSLVIVLGGARPDS